MVVTEDEAVGVVVTGDEDTGIVMTESEVAAAGVMGGVGGRGGEEVTRPATEMTPAFDARTIPEFNGSGNVVEWLEQAALLCGLRSVSLMAVLPTRLRGGAFAVWSRMPSATRYHLPSVKAKLFKAFAMDPFSAQAEMSRRRLQPGETADVYLAALQQLAELMGGLPERAIALSFVNGLPAAAQAAVRDGIGETFSLECVLDRARAVLSRTEALPAETTAPVVAAAARMGQPRPLPVCYRCRKRGHIARECRSPFVATAPGGRPNTSGGGVSAPAPSPAEQ